MASIRPFAILALSVVASFVACGGRVERDYLATSAGSSGSPGAAGNGVSAGSAGFMAGTAGYLGTSGSAGYLGTSGSAGRAGAGSAGSAGVSVDAGMPPDAGASVTTCKQYDNFPIGSYLIETDYWNQGSCPGTQCMNVNQNTGAFKVTQGPNCGNTVASYPNVLYGSSFGAISPGSKLPLQVSAINSLLSSWDFSVGGVPSDQFDVAYDIWFCPNDQCGAAGFTGGTELMIWLDYRNTSGWQYDLGAVTIGGYSWELWTFTQGGPGSEWTYLAYIIHPPMVTSVSNLDLRAFMQDAQSRGYVQSSWYLYAVQAGDEMRTGGTPFESKSFSVTVN